MPLFHPAFLENQACRLTPHGGATFLGGHAARGGGGGGAGSTKSARVRSAAKSREIRGGKKVQESAADRRSSLVWSFFRSRFCSEVCPDFTSLHRAQGFRPSKVFCRATPRVSCEENFTNMLAHAADCSHAQCPLMASTSASTRRLLPQRMNTAGCWRGRYAMSTDWAR